MGSANPMPSSTSASAAPGWSRPRSKTCSPIRREPTLCEIAEEIKSTAFRVTRVGELIGREVAARLGVAFGIVDLSLAPTPQVGDSVGEILQAMGVVRMARRARPPRSPCSTTR